MRSPTQADEVLRHFTHIGPLTALEALNSYGIGRLAAVVFDLKKAGHPVRSEMVEVQKRRGGRAKVARYSLAAQAPAGLFPELNGEPS